MGLKKNRPGKNKKPDAKGFDPRTKTWNQERKDTKKQDRGNENLVTPRQK